MYDLKLFTTGPKPGALSDWSLVFSAPRGLLYNALPHTWPQSVGKLSVDVFQAKKSDCESCIYELCVFTPIGFASLLLSSIIPAGRRNS